MLFFRHLKIEGIERVRECGENRTTQNERTIVVKNYNMTRSYVSTTIDSFTQRDSEHIEPRMEQFYQIWVSDR